MRVVRAQVASRSLLPGDRVPSIRGLARTMNVSPSTVVEAYDRLVAEGLIQSRAGSGFYVSAKAHPPLALTTTTRVEDRAIDPFWVSRLSLDADPDAPKPGCGWLPPDWMPVEPLRRAVRLLARAESVVLTDYGPARGSLALRRLQAARLAEEELSVSPEQVLLTTSGTQAIDLICRFLLRPGDCVLVDDPCYFNFRAILRAHQVKIVSVPYTRTGPDLEQFTSILAEHQPRLYITNSAVHNPTGATLSANVAHRLLLAAEAHDLTIVEDDIFGEFEPERSVRLAALDGLNRVVRIGSSSKTLSASIRCGYIIARGDWIEELVNVQVAANFGGPSPIATEPIAEVLASSGYRKHMEEIRRRLDHARHETAGRLRSLGIEPWLMPRAGFFLWCRLPEGVESADLARTALLEGVVLAPGNVFSVSQTAAPFMRFNVAHCDSERVWNTLDRALARSKRE